VHAAVESVRVCDACGKAMCPVCDFAFKGNIHVCPTCVVLPPPPVSVKRNALAIAGIAVAVLAMAVWGALLTGAMGQHDPNTVGMMFMWLIVVPGLIAFALSLSAIDRRLGNSILLWISASLSSLFTAAFITAIVIGNLSK